MISVPISLFGYLVPFPALSQPKVGEGLLQLLPVLSLTGLQGSPLQGNLVVYREPVFFAITEERRKSNQRLA